MKTMNTNTERKVYQIDTGPVLYPHLEKKMQPLHDFISIAYIAFNKESFADFVIEQPTLVKNNVVIPHFAGIIKNVLCRNFLYAAKDEK